ncbi:MAG: hypothetical protein B7Y39_07815 [Bdellovibrio sp. 28-41-41]|nr:MAG: hypothetical protein B7Y39_07815 [Bdellovibrio sp. 28-41-41]
MFSNGRQKRITLSVILIFSVFIIIAALNRQQKTDTFNSVDDRISLLPIEANKLIQENNAFLVDVREWDEVKLGIAVSAIWMPLSKMKDQDKMFSQFLSILRLDRLVIVYCTDGKRAVEAQVELQKRGFQVVTMGGYSDWQKVGFPTTIPKNQSSKTEKH